MMQATLFLNRRVLGDKPDRAEQFWWFAKIALGTGRLEVEMKQLSVSASQEDCEAHGRAFLAELGVGLRGVLQGNWTGAECDYAEEIEADLTGEDCPIPGKTRVVRGKGRPQPPGESRVL